MCEKVNLVRGAEYYTLSLYGNYSISRSNIQDVIEKTEKFISDTYVSHLTYLMKTELENLVDDKLLLRILYVLEENKYPLRSVRTEPLRMKLYERDCGYIPPNNMEIFQDILIEKDDRQTECLVSTVNYKSIKASYIPLKSSLIALLQIPNLLDVILKYQQDLLNETTVISNIIQGKIWRSKYSKSKNIILPITMYYDDFDTGNTLGNHSGEQLLGGVYILLPFLPPHLAFKIDNILLAGIFYANDRKQFGNRVLTFSSSH